MNTDLSVAPEIAQLADPFVPAAAPVVRRTDGRIASDLSGLAAVPQRWWDLVRFDSAGPVRIPVPDAPGSWLLVLPRAPAPAATAGRPPPWPATRSRRPATARPPARCASAGSACTGPAPRTACPPSGPATR